MAVDEAQSCVSGAVEDSAGSGSLLADVLVQFFAQTISLPVMFSGWLEETFALSESGVLLTLFLLQASMVVLLIAVNNSRRALPVPALMLFVGVLSVAISIECRMKLSSDIVDVGHEHFQFLLALLDNHPAMNAFLAACNSLICVYVAADALYSGVVRHRWNLTAKAAACACARMFIGMSTQLPMPEGYTPIPGDWPPHNPSCKGFVYNPSGHTVGLLLSALDLRRRGHVTLSWIIHTVNALQALRLIATRGHFSVDIITGVLLAYAVDTSLEPVLASSKTEIIHAPKFSGRPSRIRFDIDDGAATATAILLWEKAPKTCQAICDALPIISHCIHGRNSGAEALLVTPSVIDWVQQGPEENGTENHCEGDVLFGFEAAGSCHGGAKNNADVSEIAWIYGPAAQATYWLPNGSGGFRRQAVTLNRFARIEEENDFYKQSANLPVTGQRRIVVTAVA
eukprot:g2625.t1